MSPLSSACLRSYIFHFVCLDFKLTSELIFSDGLRDYIAKSSVGEYISKGTDIVSKTVLSADNFIRPKAKALHDMYQHFSPINESRAVDHLAKHLHEKQYAELKVDNVVSKQFTSFHATKHIDFHFADISSPFSVKYISDIRSNYFLSHSQRPYRTFGCQVYRAIL